MKRTAVTLWLTGWLFCPTIILSQSTCNQLQDLISAAPERFKNLQGARDPDDASVYAAKRSLPNAVECLVYHDEGLDSYDCTWEYPNNDSLTAAHTAMVAMVRACLPSSSVRNQSGGVRFTVTDNGKYSIDVRVKQRESSSGRYRLDLSVQRNSDD